MKCVSASNYGPIIMVLFFVILNNNKSPNSNYRNLNANDLPPHQIIAIAKHRTEVCRTWRRSLSVPCDNLPNWACIARKTK